MCFYNTPDIILSLGTHNSLISSINTSWHTHLLRTCVGLLGKSYRKSRKSQVALSEVEACVPISRAQLWSRAASCPTNHSCYLRLLTPLPIHGSSYPTFPLGMKHFIISVFCWSHAFPKPGQQQQQSERVLWKNLLHTNTSAVINGCTAGPCWELRVPSREASSASHCPANGALGTIFQALDTASVLLQWYDPMALLGANC